jgi:hypothetical protein
MTLRTYPICTGTPARQRTLLALIRRADEELHPRIERPGRSRASSIVSSARGHESRHWAAVTVSLPITDR